MFWRDSGAIHCSIYKRCIAATIARIWIPNLDHVRSVDMSALCLFVHIFDFLLLLQIFRLGLTHCCTVFFITDLPSDEQD